MTAQETVVMVLDWMAAHKVTDSAARDMWRICKVLLPKEVGDSYPGWWKMKETLRKYEVSAMERIDLCPNDCIAYWDSKNLLGNEVYRHAHRTKCPVCNTSRYVVDPKTGAKRPAKVVLLRCS